MVRHTLPPCLTVGVKAYFTSLFSMKVWKYLFYLEISSKFQSAYPLSCTQPLVLRVVFHPYLPHSHINFNTLFFSTSLRIKFSSRFSLDILILSVSTYNPLTSFIVSFYIQPIISESSDTKRFIFYSARFFFFIFTPPSTVGLHPSIFILSLSSSLSASPYKPPSYTTNILPFLSHVLISAVFPKNLLFVPSFWSSVAAYLVIILLPVDPVLSLIYIK